MGRKQMSTYCLRPACLPETPEAAAYRGLAEDLARKSEIEYTIKEISL